MEAYYDLKDMLCKELENIAKKGELSAGDLDVVDKLTHSIKSLVTIIAMEDGGYSNGNEYRRRDHAGRYMTGNSYNHRHDGYSDRRYSRDEGKSSMIQRLEEMTEEISSKEAREVLQSALSKLKSM